MQPSRCIHRHRRRAASWFAYTPSPTTQCTRRNSPSSEPMRAWQTALATERREVANVAESLRARAWSSQSNGTGYSSHAERCKVTTAFWILLYRAVRVGAGRAATTGASWAEAAGAAAGAGTAGPAAGAGGAGPAPAGAASGAGAADEAAASAGAAGAPAGLGNFDLKRRSR